MNPRKLSTLGVLKEAVDYGLPAWVVPSLVAQAIFSSSMTRSKTAKTQSQGE